MGLLDLDAMQWALAPAPTRTTTVIDRLLDGDRVVTWVQDQGCGRLGPKVQVGLSAAGRETLTLVDEPGSTAAPTRLEDLPRF